MILSFNKFIKNFKKQFLKFHEKSIATYIYVSIAFFLLLFFVFLNFLFVGETIGNFNETINVIQNWNTITTGAQLAIKQELWSIAATLIAGIGLSLAAVSAQVLTNNPIAEGSTLGSSQAAIFGILLISSFGFTSLVYKYLFAILAQIVSALLLFAIIAFAKGRSSKQKVILIGLAIGIIFRTLSFIFRQGNETQSALSYVYTLGGAEAIVSNSLAVAENQFETTLLVSFCLIISALIISIFNIRGMNVLALNDEKSKTLGQRVWITKLISILVLGLTIPASIIIVGNLAFLGLFSVNFAKWFTKSRDYKKVLPMTILIGMLIASFGYQLSQFVPQVNSGLWMTFIGAPYLIYLGVKGIR